MKGSRDMRILVVSDTHGNEYALRQTIPTQPEAELIFHLGDGAREALSIAEEFPNRQFRMVCGNGDFGYSALLPDSGMEETAGPRIFYTHGHRYNVKMGIYQVVCAARERKADILLFGHTHNPVWAYHDGLYIMNPGSLAYGTPTYGFIDITDAGIAANITELQL